MSDSERLRRSYLRLMWAYPRWYRQERGTEMLTTLLDDAAAGQRRPTRADAVDLIRGGVRVRLRPPRGIACYAAATIVALYVAALSVPVAAAA